ncbi:TPA: Fic family protein [Vibrio vulnificus]|nr:Fic family protein [Vibrio vulnificus]
MKILNVDDAPSKMVHIKNTRRNSTYCKVFWNKTISGVFTSKSVHGAFHRLDELTTYEEDFRKTNREVQIGDSVCYVFGIPLVPLFFCSITGKQVHSDGNVYVFLEPNNPKSPAIPTWRKFESERFIFVSDNRPGTKNDVLLDTNVYAVCREELDIAEEIYAEARVPIFLKSYLEDETKPIGEVAFKKCHEVLFKGIYPWAGKYRNEEIIVHTERRKTMSKDQIEVASSKFFGSLTRSQLRKINCKEAMIKTLVDTHKELAWIHPFQDGNGRAIRLFLELLALTQGYKFELKAFVETGRGKKSYYYAVRESLSGRHMYIMKLFDRCTEEIK